MTIAEIRDRRRKLNPRNLVCKILGVVEECLDALKSKTSETYANDMLRGMQEITARHANPMTHMKNVLALKRGHLGRVVV